VLRLYPMSPMRSSRLLPVLAVVVVCVVGACGGTSPSGGAGTNPTSSGSTPEDLTFTGELAGHMSSGSRGDAYVCAGSTTQLVAGPIVGDVSGETVSINIVKLSFTGPGTYPGSGVAFDEGPNHYFPALGASPTGFVVNADLRSGTMDLDLAVNSDVNTVVGHVTGSWRCPPDPS
jgi:hypothetical protein